MIKSVGIDLAGVGEHKVRCLDEEAQLCDGFGFETSPEGLAKLPGRIKKSEEDRTSITMHSTAPENSNDNQ